MSLKYLYNPKQSDYEKISSSTEGRKLLVCSGSIYPYQKVPKLKLEDISFEEPSEKTYKEYSDKVSIHDNFEEWLNSK